MGSLSVTFPASLNSILFAYSIYANYYGIEHHKFPCIQVRQKALLEESEWDCTFLNSWNKMVQSLSTSKAISKIDGICLSEPIKYFRSLFSSSTEGKQLYETSWVSFLTWWNKHRTVYDFATLRVEEELYKIVSEKLKVLEGNLTDYQLLVVYDNLPNGFTHSYRNGHIISFERLINAQNYSRIADEIIQ